LRFAKRSSTNHSAARAGSLVALVVVGAVVGVLGVAFSTEWLALVGLVFAVTAAGALAATLLASERHQDERVEEELERLSTEHARLSDQLITAEQEERRRLALFLHDGPVQSMSGIALMLDAVVDAVEGGRTDEAKQVLGSALEKQRDTIRSLRDLSFELEPVVLRDQGFGPAVHELAQQLGMSNQIQIELDVETAESLTEHAQVAIFQIIREALHQSVRRGPPTRVLVSVSDTDGAVETVISDDAPGERRRAGFDAIAERARSLSGRMSIDPNMEGGTAVRIVFPTYRVRRETRARPWPPRTDTASSSRSRPATSC
jgi:signal transduction histidine kinase